MGCGLFFRFFCFFGLGWLGCAVWFVGTVSYGVAHMCLYVRSGRAVDCRVLKPMVFLALIYSFLFLFFVWLYVFINYFVSKVFDILNASTLRMVILKVILSLNAEVWPRGQKNSNDRGRIYYFMLIL